MFNRIFRVRRLENRRRVSASSNETRRRKGSMDTLIDSHVQQLEACSILTVKLVIVEIEVGEISLSALQQSNERIEICRTKEG